MIRYEQVIKELCEAKRDMHKAMVQIDEVLTAVFAMQELENEQANQMGKELEGTLRSEINKIDKLTSGELKSTWRKDV